MKIRIETPNDKLVGFRYFWAKTVNDFDSSVHCAKCLIGDYIKQVGTKMAVNEVIDINVPDSQVVYLCGVAVPYKWENNAHIAVRQKQGALAILSLYNGDKVMIKDAERVEFDDLAAKTLHPNKGKAFLTCRNFQFGSHHFKK